jgi:hypothetical protein
MTVAPYPRTRPPASLRPLRALAYVYCGVVAAALAVIYRASIRWEVVAPMVTAVVIVILFLLYLRSVEGTVPYFEIGAFYVAVTALYIVHPLLTYVLQGYSYEKGDYRIMVAAPYPVTLATLGWWYVLYLVCFCVAYAAVRGRRPLHGRLAVSRPGWPMVISILILLAAARLFFAGLGLVFDMHATSYLDRYLVIQRLPLFVRQIAAQVQGIDLTLQLMLVIALTCGKRRSFSVLLVLFLGMTIVSQLLFPGGRIELVVVIVAALAAHHLVVRRLPFRWMLGAAVAGFLALAVMAGVRTEGFDLERLQARMSDQTEFEVIFGNAIDLLYLRNAEGVFLGRPNLYWSGVLALVPQQILPIPKDTPGDWYVRTYYTEYFDAGGGLAFGVLSEAVAGHGWPEMIWRGGLVGLLFALSHRALYRPRVSVYYFTFSIWLMAWSYLTLRAGTFAPLMLILYRVIVPMAGVALLSVLLPRGYALGRVQRRARPAGQHSGNVTGLTSK